MTETLRLLAGRSAPEAARSAWTLEDAAHAMGIMRPEWLLLMCEHGLVPFVQVDGGPPRFSLETVARGRPDWRTDPFAGVSRRQIAREQSFRRDRIAGWRRGERWMIPVRR